MATHVIITGIAFRATAAPTDTGAAEIGHTSATIKGLIGTVKKTA